MNRKLVVASLAVTHLTTFACAEPDDQSEVESVEQSLSAGRSRAAIVGKPQDTRPVARLVCEKTECEHLQEARAVWCITCRSNATAMCVACKSGDSRDCTWACNARDCDASCSAVFCSTASKSTCHE